MGFEEKLFECAFVEVDIYPEWEAPEYMDILVCQIFSNGLSDNLRSQSAALIALNDEIFLKQEFVTVDYAEYKRVVVLYARCRSSFGGSLNLLTVLKLSILEIWRLRAASCTLCALASLSEASSATEWACFQTSNSTSSSETLFSNSVFLWRVTLDKSGNLKSGTEEEVREKLLLRSLVRVSSLQEAVLNIKKSGR